MTLYVVEIMFKVNITQQSQSDPSKRLFMLALSNIPGWLVTGEDHSLCDNWDILTWILDPPLQSMKCIL